MRRIIAGTFLSLDGVMQAPGGPDEDPRGGFKFGGWTAPYWDEAIGAVIGEGFATPYDLLLGRRTYDIFAAYWSYIETDPSGSNFDALVADIANTFNRITKYVATHSPDTLTWQNSRSLGTDVVAGVRDLKKGVGPDLIIQGSSELIQQLLTADLIDEFRLLIYPVLLGKGRRLFGDGTIPAAFKVTKSAVSPTGVLMATYQRDGDVKAGSFVTQPPSAAELERRRTLR